MMMITKDDGGDDHYCRGSRLRLRASSIIDDIASWWTVAPLVLLTIIMTVMMTHLNINHDFFDGHDHYDHLVAHVLSIPIGESGAPRLGDTAC